MNVVDVELLKVLSLPFVLGFVGLLALEAFPAKRHPHVPGRITRSWHHLRKGGEGWGRRSVGQRSVQTDHRTARRGNRMSFNAKHDVRSGSRLRWGCRARTQQGSSLRRPDVFDQPCAAGSAA